METLEQKITAYRDAMVSLTQELIRIPTENPPGNCYQQSLDLLTHHLRQLGFTDIHVEGECLLAFAGTGERTLYFSGHYDVVPAQSPSQFEPAIRGPNLFGRGSSDMKSGLAAMIYAAKTLMDCDLLRAGRIGLVLVPDEETAGPRGSQFLSQRGMLGENGIGMLTPEPTGGVIWNACRGAITLNITVRGKSAHVGRQHEGVNAFEGMLEAARALQELKAQVEQHRTQFRIAPAAARSILLLGGRASGGTNFNVVPDSCSFTVDRRINPEEDFEQEKQRLFDVLDSVRARGIELEVEILQEGRSCGVAEDTDLGWLLAKNIERVTGRGPQFEMCPGLLEIRFYAERQIPAYAYGPGLLTVSHGPDEFVPMDRIVQCAQVYAMTAADLLGHSGNSSSLR